MIFDDGNKQRYSQDYRNYIGVPSNINFRIKATYHNGIRRSIKNISIIELIAYGYGMIKDVKSYGNGTIHILISELTKEQKNKELENYIKN